MALSIELLAARVPAPPATELAAVRDGPLLVPVDDPTPVANRTVTGRLRRCRAVMETPRRMKVGWIEIAACHAYHFEDPSMCTPDDWPCVVADALARVEDSAEPCTRLPAGASRRACEIVTGQAELTAVCAEDPDSILCGVGEPRRDADLTWALRLFENAWRLRVEGDYKAITDIYAGTSGERIYQWAVLCILSEWLRYPLYDRFGIGCITCLKQRLDVDDLKPRGRPRCPVAIEVVGSPAARRVTNPLATPLTCWVVAGDRLGSEVIPPGTWGVSDPAVTEFRCLPEP